MNDRKRARAIILMVLLLCMCAEPSGVSAQGAESPFSYIPDGWLMWQRARDGAVLWLPENAETGAMQSFMMVIPGDRQDEFLSTYIGGGTSVWVGSFTSADIDWQAVIAENDTTHGMVAVTSQAVQGDDAGDVSVVPSGGALWTIVAVSPKNDWESVAPVFNSVLRGGS